MLILKKMSFLIIGFAIFGFHLCSLLFPFCATCNPTKMFYSFDRQKYIKQFAWNPWTLFVSRWRGGNCHSLNGLSSHKRRYTKNIIQRTTLLSPQTDEDLINNSYIMTQYSRQVPIFIIQIRTYSNGQQLWCRSLCYYKPYPLEHSV